MYRPRTAPARRSGGLPVELQQGLDHTLIASVLGQARLDAAAAVGGRGFDNLERLAFEASRVLMENPTLSAEVRQVLSSYVDLIKVNMHRAAVEW